MTSVCSMCGFFPRYASDPHGKPRNAPRLLMLAGTLRARHVPKRQARPGNEINGRGLANWQRKPTGRSRQIQAQRQWVLPLLVINGRVLASGKLSTLERTVKRPLEAPRTTPSSRGRSRHAPHRFVWGARVGALLDQGVESGPGSEKKGEGLRELIERDHRRSSRGSLVGLPAYPLAHKTHVSINTGSPTTVSSKANCLWFAKMVIFKYRTNMDHGTTSISRLSIYIYILLL